MEKKKIVLCVAFVFLLFLSFIAGYSTRDYNVLSEGFLNYNLKLTNTHVIKQIELDNIDNILPKIIESKKLNRTFVSLNRGTGSPETEEIEITINKIDSAGFAGFQNPLEPNSIYSNDIENEVIIAHEFCHIILHKYGINDMVLNEDVCYTVGENYRWRD